MARFMKKVAGGSALPARYLFELELHSVDIRVPYEVTVLVIWKSKSKRVESSTNPVVSKETTQANFAGERLKMLSTVQKNVKGGYQERLGHLVVQIVKDEKSKAVGIVKINLPDFIDDQIKGGLANVAQKLSLEKCPDKQANIQFTIRPTLISANPTQSEAMSCMMSDMQSVDSGPKSDCDFNDFEQDDVKKKPKRVEDVLIKAVTRIGSGIGSGASKLPSVRLVPERGRKIDSGPLDTLEEQPENESPELKMQKSPVQRSLSPFKTTAKFGQVVQELPPEEDDKSVKLSTILLSSDEYSGPVTPEDNKVSQFSQQVKLRSVSKSSERGPLKYKVAKTAEHEKLKSQVSDLQEKLFSAAEELQDQRQATLRQKEASQSEITKLESQLTKSSQRADAVTLQLRQQTGQNEALHEQNETYLQSLKDQAARSKDAEDEHQEEKARLEESAKREGERRVELQGVAEEAQGAVREREGRMRGLQGDVERLRGKLEQVRVEGEEKHESDLGAERAQITTLEEKLEGVEQVVRERDTACEELEFKLAHSAQQAVLSNAEIEQLKGENEKRQEALTIRASEVKELQGKLDTDALSHTEFKNQATNAQKALENTVEQVQTERKTQNKRITGQEKKVRELESKLLDLEDERIVCEQEMTKREQELRGQVSEEQEKMAEVEARMHSEVSASQDQLNSERSLTSQLRETLTTHQQDQQEWLQKEMHHQKEKTTLKDQMRKAEQERDQLGLQCKQQEAQSTALQQQNEQYLAQLKEQNQRAIDLESEQAKQMEESSRALQQEQARLKESELALGREKNAVREKERHGLALSAEVELLQGRVEQIKRENDQTAEMNLTAVEQSLKKTIHEHEDLIDALSHAKLDAEGQNEELMFKLEEAEGLCLQATEELEEHEVKAEEVKQQLGQRNAEIKDLQGEIDTANLEFTELTNQAQNEKKALENRLEQAKTEQKAANKRIKEKENRVQTLESEKLDLADEKLQLVQEHQEKLTSQKAMSEYQLNDSKRHILDLEAKNQNFDGTMAGSQKKIELLEKDMAEYKQKTAKAQEAARSDLEKQKALLQSEADERKGLQSILVQKGEEIDNLQEQNATSAVQIRSAATKMKALEEKYLKEAADRKDEFQQQLSQQERKVTDNQEKLNAEATVLREKETRIAELEEKLTSLSGRIADVKLEAEKKLQSDMRIIEKQVSSQMMDLRKENTRLGQNLADKESLAESLSCRLETLESGKGAGEAELARTQMQLRRVEEHLASQTQELKEVQADFDQAEIEATEVRNRAINEQKLLENRLEQGDSQKEALEKIIESKEEKMAQLSGQVSELEAANLTSAHYYNTQMQEQQIEFDRQQTDQQQQMVGLEAELTLLRAQKESEREKLEKLLTENSQDYLQKLKDQAAKAKENETQFKDSEESLRVKLDLEEKKSHQSFQKLILEKQVVVERDQQIKDLQTDINTLNKRIEEVRNKDESESGAKIAELEGKNDKLNEKIREHERQTQAAEFKETSALVSAQSDLLSAFDKITELETKSVSRKSKLNTLRDQMAKQSLELTELQSQEKLLLLKIEQSEYDKTEIKELQEQLAEQENEQYEAIIELKEEIKSLKKQLRQTAPALVDDKSPRPQQMPASDLQRQLKERTLEYDELQQQYLEMENDLVTAKMAWAQLDLENDELTVSNKKQKAQLRGYASKVTQLEIENMQGRTEGGSSTQEDEPKKRNKKSATQKLSGYFFGKINKEKQEKDKDSDKKENSTQASKKSIWNTPL